jgi:hypothetical protein
LISQIGKFEPTTEFDGLGKIRRVTVAAEVSVFTGGTLFGFDELSNILAIESGLANPVLSKLGRVSLERSSSVLDNPLDSMFEGLITTRLG